MISTTSSFEVEDMFDLLGKRTVIAGKLLNGSISAGMVATINTRMVTIGGLEVPHKQMSLVRSTDPEARSMGVLLMNVSKEDIEDFLKSNRVVVFSTTPESGQVLNNPQSPMKVSGTKDKIIVISFIVGLMMLGALVFILLGK